MSAFDNQEWLNAYSEWTLATLDYESKTLADWFDAAVAAAPNRPATWFMGRSTSYSELAEQVHGAVAGLRALGVRPGDRVAVALPNCPQHVAAFYAILKLGAIVVEHNPQYTAHELRKPFLNHGAKIAIVWDSAAEVFESLRRTTDLETIIAVNMIEAMPTVQQWALRLPIPKLKATRRQLHVPARQAIPWKMLISPQIGGDGMDFISPELTMDTTAVLMYTSGTTGEPKGVALSHGNLYANLRQGEAWVRNLESSGARILAALPFFHAYGLTMAMTLSVYVRGEMLLLPTPRIDLILNAIRKRRPTWFTGVPLLFERTIDATEKDRRTSLKTIQAAFCGAANLPQAMIKKWEDQSSSMFVEGYGLTETSPILIGTPLNDKRKLGYIGVPFPDTQIRIANPDNLDETMPDGQEGEILAKGPQVFSGYYNNPEATAAAFHNGWFRTGDLGVMDSDGFVKLVSRIKEVIITGGFNVYPFEVEEVVREHPSVKDVAVVGRPRSDGSEDVVACVVLNDRVPLDPEDLKAFCRQRLTRYKVPRTFYHFDELPTSAVGKVVRREVQAALLEKLAK